jgi:hypothetical protein
MFTTKATKMHEEFFGPAGKGMFTTEVTEDTEKDNCGRCALRDKLTSGHTDGLHCAILLATDLHRYTRIRALRFKGKGLVHHEEHEDARRKTKKTDLGAARKGRWTEDEC